MGRKRLLTILAAVTAAATLQVGTAAAAEGECRVLGEDLSLSQLLRLDKTVCVLDGTGKLVQGTLDGVTDTTKKVLDGATEVVDGTLKGVTDTVDKTVTSVTDAATGGGAKAPTPDPSPEPTSPSSPAPKEPGSKAPGSTAPEAGSPSGGSEGSADPGGAREPDVAASGDVTEARERDASREGQLAALRALRSDLAAGTPLEHGVAGPVQPFGDLGSTDDLAAPQVADGGDVVPGVEDGRLTPQVAPAAPQQRDAVLATSSPLERPSGAPVALQLLAAALVLGAATVWTIASRELGKGQTTSA